MVTIQCKQVSFEGVLAILWDKDGTLANSHMFLRELADLRSRQIETQTPGVYSRLMATFGCQEDAYDPTGLMAVGTRYDNEVAAAAHIAATGCAWTEALSIAKTAFAESDRCVSRKAAFTPPFEGIPTLLKNFAAAGLKQAILSGDTTENIRDFISCYGLTDLIQWCAGSERPPTKPDPRMFAVACAKLGVVPWQCIVIGDSELDSQLACRGGAQGFIGVTWGGSPTISGAHVTVSRPAQLIASLA